MTIEQQQKILHAACEKCGLDGHLVTADKMSELYTWAEKIMHKTKAPHKNSYVFCDTVDVCFYIDSGKACCTFAAKWRFGAADLHRDTYNKAFTTINDMLYRIQAGIDEILESEEQE